ncbi:hypothetical protein JOC76_002752 [Neobacillus cucumis]|nr:hypothetical protein [Neobacillus cucumis]
MGRPFVFGLKLNSITKTLFDLLYHLVFLPNTLPSSNHKINKQRKEE